MRIITAIYKKISLLFILFVMVNSLVGARVDSNELLQIGNKTHNILIINSYDENNMYEQEIVEGIKKEISNYEYLNFNIKVEYLDCKNINDDEYYNRFNELLKTKYSTGDVDLIVTINDEAYYLMKEQVTEINSQFYNIPLIYAAVNNEHNLKEEENERIVGFTDKSNIVRLVNLLENLDSEIQVIDVLFEDSEQCNEMRKEIEEAISFGWNEVQVNFIKSNYVEDIISQLSNLESSGKAIIIAGQFRYKSNNKIISPREVIDVLSLYSNAPIYSIEKEYLNEDIVGGIFNEGNYLGENIGKAILRILQEENTDLSDLGVGTKQNIYFNYEKLYESNIDVLKIPKDSIILNKPFYGTLIPKQVRVFLVLLGVGLSIIIILLISYAIDKRTKLKEEKKNKEIAKERERLQSDFIVNMSHELRTPLNIILNSTKLIELKVRNDDYDEDYFLKRLHNINQNSNRLLKLINNVIDITKVESGFLILNLRNYNIVKVVEDIFEEVIDYGKKKNIEIIFDTSEEEIIVAIDKEKIERVVLNILSNAIKYTPEGRSIHGRVEKEENMIKIEIQDEGVGIPEDKLHDIFHKFYQVESTLSRSNEGSGIGLCIVKELVSLHDGTIIVKSEVGKGTTFVIKVPVNEVDKLYEAEDKVMWNLTEVVNREMSDISK